MNKEFDGGFVHRVDFGKGQSAAHQPSQSLAQGVVEALDVTSLTLPFTGVMLFGWQDGLIGFPKVTVTQSGFVALGNALPQQPTSSDAARTQSISYDLPGAAAQSQPQPALVFTLFDK